MGSPSTKLVGTPAPQAQNPGANQTFMQTIAGLGPQAGSTLSGAMSGQVPNVTGAVMPAYQAMVDASKTQVNQGEQNLLESFSQMGLRNSSSAQTADVNYQGQVSKDFASILSQYMLGTQGQVMGNQLGAAQGVMGQLGAAGMQTYAPAALVSGPSPLSQISGFAELMAALFV